MDVTGPVPPAAVAWLAGAHHQRFDGGLAEIAQLLTRQGTGAGMLVNARPVGAAIGHLFLLHNDGKQIWIHDQHAQQPQKVFDPENPPFAAETTHALRLTRRDGASTLESRQQQLGENNPHADPDIARGRALRPADAGTLPPSESTRENSDEPALSDTGVVDSDSSPQSPFYGWDDNGRYIEFELDDIWMIPVPSSDGKISGAGFPGDEQNADEIRAWGLTDNRPGNREFLPVWPVSDVATRTPDIAPTSQWADDPQPEKAPYFDAETNSEPIVLFAHAEEDGYLITLEDRHTGQRRGVLVDGVVFGRIVWSSDYFQTAFAQHPGSQLLLVGCSAAAGEAHRLLSNHLHEQGFTGDVWGGRDMMLTTDEGHVCIRIEVAPDGTMVPPFDVIRAPGSPHEEAPAESPPRQAAQNETTAVHGHDAARIAPGRDLVQQTRARRDSVAEELSINPAELQPGSLRIIELQDELNELRTKLAPLAGVPRSELTDEQRADRRRAAQLHDLIEATTEYHELDARTARTNAVEPGQVRAPVGRTIVEGLGLPAEVATAEIIGEDPTAALLPQEQALIEAIQSDPEGVREREIVYGRTCAHRALARLGVPVEPVLRAGGNVPGGMPLWQPGIAGSISHTLGFTLTQKTGYYVAAVSRHHRSIGIDAAHNEPISDVLRNRIALPEEQAWLSRIGTHRGVHWDRVLFSAKESVYKAWYPLTHRALDFEDALITFDLDEGTFTARLLIEDRSTLDGQPLTEFHGRFLVDGGVILTGITVPQPLRDAAPPARKPTEPQAVSEPTAGEVTTSSDHGPDDRGTPMSSLEYARHAAEESVGATIEEIAPQWPTVARAAAVETVRAVVTDAARHGATRQRVEAPHAEVLRVTVEHEGAADLAPELVQTLDAGTTSWRAELYDTGSRRVICDFHLRGDSLMAPEPADASAKLTDDPVVASRVVRVGPTDEAAPTIRALAFVMIRPDMPFWNHIGPAVNDAAALAETLVREVSQGRQAVTATASITQSGRWSLEVVEDGSETPRSGRIVYRPSEYRPLGNSATGVLDRATAALSDRVRSSIPEAAPGSARPDAADGVTDAGSLRVVTWNFAGARRSRSDEAFDYIPDPSYFVRELPEIGAQIVFLQESEVGPDGSNARELADALGYRNVYETVMCPSYMDTTKAISLAVLTDLPIEAGLDVLLPATGLELTLGNHVLEQDEQFDRYAQAVRIAGTWYVNVHPTPLGFFGRSYEEHEDVDGAAHARAIEQLLRSLVDGLRSAADGPVVLLGDFNTDNPRSVYQALIGELGLAVALDPATVTVPWGSAPDQVMATAELQTTHSGIVLTETDHYPVVVDLSLAAADSPPSPSAVRETPAESAGSALDIPERKAWDIGTVPPPRGQRFDPGLVHAMGPHPEGRAVGGRGSRPTSGESAETASPGTHESASRSTGSAGQTGDDSVDRIPASESGAINPAPESHAHTAPSHQLQELIAQDVANGHAEQATRRVQEVFGDRVVQLAGSALGSRHAPEILEEVAGNVVAHLGQIGDRSLEEWVALVARNVIAEHRRIAELWRSVQLFLVLGASLSESDSLIAAWNEATTADMRRGLGALPAYHRAPLHRFQTAQRTTTTTQLRPPGDPANESPVLWDAARALGIAIAAGQGVRATLPVEPTPRRALTDRELEVNRLQAAGRTVAEIAESLHIAASTVRVLQSRIRAKLHPLPGPDSPTATSPESREAEVTDTSTSAPEIRMLPGRGGLTGPEITVLTLLYQGLSLSEIATALGMKPRKVTYHRITAATRLGVSKAIPTVVEARRRGLLSSVVTASATPDIFGLNAKDMELLRLTAEGLTDEEIAERQQLTVSGISERRVSLGEKLGVREKIPSFMKALRLGLLDGDDHAVAAPKREAPPQHVESPEGVRGDDAIPASVETATDGALIRHVLPDDVHAVETFGNKRSSVLSVWLNAQQALQALGYGDEPIRTGDDGSPLWPGDLTGATARTQQYAAVALGPVGTYRAISLDAKDHASARLHRDSVVVSAKDNVIDLYHRLTGQQLRHNQVEIALHPDVADAPAGTFEARVTADAASDPSLTILSGRFHLQHGTLVTAITLRNDEGVAGSDPEGAVALAEAAQEPEKHYWSAGNKGTTVATEGVTDSDDRQRSATVDGEADAGRVPAAANGTAAPMRRPAAARRVGLIGGVPDLVDPFDDRGKPWDRSGPVSKHKQINRLVEPHADGGGFARGGTQDDPTTTEPATPPETAERPGWRPLRMREEVELGRRLYQRQETREVTVAVLDRLRKLLGALHPEATPEEIDAAFYAPENERWGGMVERSVSLAELRRDGNPRELMSAVLNAMIRNAQLGEAAAGTTLDEGLAKLLNRPDWAEKAGELGLDVAALRDVRASILRNGPTVTAAELRDVNHAVLDSAAAREAFAEYEGRVEASKNRTPDMMLRRHLTVQDWALLGMPLSQRELEAIPGELHALRIDRLDLDASLPRRRGRVDVVKLETTLRAEDDTVSHVLPLYRYDENGRRVRDDAGDAVVEAVLVYRDEGVVDAATALALDTDRYAVPLTWRPGVALVEFQPGSPWFREVAVERGIPLAAGISGSAARLMSRFTWLGLPKEWEGAFRGAVAAFMIPHHHTLYETELGMRMVGQGMVDESVFPTRDGDPEDLFRAARELPRTSTPMSPDDATDQTPDDERGPRPDDVLALRGEVPGFGAEAGSGLDVPERKKWDNEGAVPPPRGQRFDFGMLHAVDPNVGLDGHAFRRPGREHTDSAVHESESGTVGSAGQSGAHAATSGGIRITPAGLIVPADPTRSLIVPAAHVLPADPSLEELMERLRPWKEIFWYFWEFPMPREGELSGRKWIESSERKAWMRRRAIRRAPLYAGVDAAVRLTLGAERLLKAPHATSGPATLQQRRVIPGRGEIDAGKKRTMRADAQVREANRADVEEMTAFEKFWRGVSGDELPQTKQIRQGDMAYVGGRLLRAEGHNLMVAGRYAEGYNLMVAGRDPVLTPEEYALWLMFGHDALWTVHYPGCRELEPQSPDFLLTRYLTVAIFDKIASRPLEVQYLDDVVRPYLRRQGLAAGRVLLHELSHHLPESCRSTVEQLGMWALRGLGRKMGAEVEEHLDNCAACRDSAAALPVVDSRLGDRKLIVPPGPAGDGSTAHHPASKHPTAPEPRDREPETPAAERGAAVDPSPEATQRIGTLQARMTEMNRITVQRHREDAAVSADRLNRAYDKIEAELARLRTTGKVIDDVPVVAGPDHQLAMDSVFHPQRAYERAYRDAMNGLLGYPVVRATVAPAEAQDRLVEIRRSIDRVAELAAGAGRAEEIGEFELLVTIFEWTEQADSGGRLILPESEQAEQRGAAAPERTATQLLDSADSDTGTATAIAPANSMRADHVRPEYDSIETRRERARHGGHRAALPDETVRAVPESDETADLGRVSNLYAALMPDGRIVHFRLLGHPYGYPVLLSPGTPVGVDGPLPNHHQLYDRGFTVIVVERPGYGDSDPLPGRTVADCARDIIHIATELFAFDRYSVLGRSGGGSVAIAVGALDPDHVDRVVSLVGTAPRLDDMGEWMAGMAEANQRIYARPDTEAMAATLTRMAENIARDGEWLLRYNQDAFTTMDHMWVGTHRDELARGYQRALRNYLRAWADDAIQLTGHWGIRFDQYRVPVDIVHGASDQFSPVDHSRNNARLIPTSKLYLFRGVSHMMGMDALPVIASHFRAERDAWGNTDFRRDEHRIQAIRRAESNPLPFPKWMYWARGRWDSVPDYELDLPPQRARGLDGLGFDPPSPVPNPFSGMARGVPYGAVAHAADPNLREDGAFAGSAHTLAPSVAVQSRDEVSRNLPAPLVDQRDVASDPRTARHAQALGPGAHAPFDPAAVLDLPPHRARGLDGLGFGPPPTVADPFGGVPRGLPDGVVAHAANPNDPNSGAFGGGREAERIASAALSTFRVEATFGALQDWAARLSDDNLQHLLVGFTRTVTEQIAAIHRGKPPSVTDSVTNPARLLGTIVTEATRRFGDSVPPSAPTTYRELFAIGHWLRANRRTVADLHAAMTAVLDAAFAVTRTSTVHRWSVGAAHHTVPAHIAEIARYIEEAGQHSMWPEEGSFPPDAALTTEHVPLVESFRWSGVRANATARMVTEWATVLDALLRVRSDEIFSRRYAAIFESLPIHAAALDRARTGSDRLFAATAATALPDLLDAAFYLLPTSNSALGLDYLSQVDGLLAEATTRFTDNFAVYALRNAAESVRRLREDIITACSRRSPEVRARRIHETLSDYFSVGPESALTRSFGWGVRALWGLGSQQPGIDYAPMQHRLDAVLPRDWDTTDDERALAATATDLLRNVRGPDADIRSLSRHSDSPDLFEDTFDSVGANMRWWYRLGRWTSGNVTIGSLLAGATDFSVSQMQLAVLRQYPHIIGAAPGIEYRARDLANRLSLARDLGSPRIAPERRHELAALRDQLAQLRHDSYRLAIPGSSPPPVLLASYDPVAEGGTGRAVISIGEADSASFISFNVTGVDTPVTDLSHWSVRLCQQYEKAQQNAPRDTRVAIMLTVGSSRGIEAPAPSSRSPRAAGPDRRRRWAGWRRQSADTAEPDTMPMDDVVAARDVAGATVARELITYDATRELALDGSAESFSRRSQLFTVIGHGDGIGVLRSAADTLHLSQAVDQIVLVPGSVDDRLPTASQLNIGTEHVYTLNPHRDRNSDPNTIGLIMVGRGSDIESASDTSSRSAAPLIETPTTVRELSQLLPAHEYRPLEGIRGWTMTRDEGLTVYRAAQPLLNDALSGTYNTTVVLDDLGLVLRIGQPDTGSFDPRFGPEHKTLPVISRYVRNAPQLLNVITGRMPDGRVIDESAPILIERLARGDNLAETFRRADRRTIRSHQSLIMRTFANIHEQLRAMPEDHPLLDRLTPPGVARGDTGGWYLNHIDWYTINFYRQHYDRFGHLFDEFGLLRGNPFEPLIDDARSMRESRHHILHADPNEGNFLISNELRVTLLDWELAVTGPSAYDWARLGHLIPGIEVPRELGGPDMVKFARLEKFKRVMNDTVKLAPLAAAGLLTPREIEFIHTEFSEAVIQVRQLSGHTNLLPPRAELEILRSWRP
ncbi:alpha/beta fold hydrolase [Nocardia abscessus]|uniref:alpha/beta fold hydrolase n=1 Tax=Nocardia abscessus TaxID=120957 RepID=UPI002454911A|nr:alpha/beta fold hydrolase [Nocardia abscessus]